MTWNVWIETFLLKYCVSQGLRPRTLLAYKEVLQIFEEFAIAHLKQREPQKITTQGICDYIAYLREVRGNANATVNKSIVVVKSFYKCAVAFELISPSENPTRHLPRMKRALEIAGDVLTMSEINKLTNAPDPRTIVGVRDRAMLLLLCTTGIRASECEGILMKDIDETSRQIKIRGKGGHERRVNLNKEAAVAVKNYLRYRINSNPRASFFKVRTGNRLTRWRIYERVRHYLRRASIFKQISPHRLRHSFATQMIKRGTNVVVLKELLGHRCITSTMRYIQISGEQLRSAVEKLVIDTTFEKILDKFPVQKMRYQNPMLDSS